MFGIPICIMKCGVNLQLFDEIISDLTDFLFASLVPF